MNNFGIMFHHFHDAEKHIKSQGSISGDELSQIISYLKENYDILDAGLWYENAINNSLKPNQICFTFDDALACQYDVAYPVLKENNIKAFWFIYTSVHTGALEKLEIYRHFRFSCFDTIDSFYESFFRTAVFYQSELKADIETEIKQFNRDEYFKQRPFYSENDLLFRYLRDIVLGPEKYNFIMDDMIKKSGYNIDRNKDLLWITKDQIINLHESGHVIGLHSHTHPTFMAQYCYEEQLNEYRQNKKILEAIIKSKVSTISYPCNSYNEDTDKIMDNLGIKLGFDAIMSVNEPNHLHFPRKDHVNVMKEMLS